MSEIEQVAVAGAGLMGSGIAESVARAGVPVAVYEPEQGPLDNGRARLEKSIWRGVERGKTEQADAEAMLERITFTTELTDLGDADLVIEAITENEDAKVSLFAELDEALPPDAILASNTSSIPIAGLASHTKRPDRVIGLHFFSPVPVMGLVEIVIGLQTSEETVSATEEFTGKIGKTAIHTKDRSGFVVNFLLVPYLMAAVRMYEEGFATREDIDQGMKLGCGHPMGPLALCDLIGLDVLYSVCGSLYEEFKRDEYAPPPLMKRMVASGMLGRKTGQGFYEYDAS